MNPKPERDIPSEGKKERILQEKPTMGRHLKCLIKKNANNPTCHGVIGARPICIAQGPPGLPQYIFPIYLNPTVDSSTRGPNECGYFQERNRVTLLLPEPFWWFFVRNQGIRVAAIFNIAAELRDIFGGKSPLDRDLPPTY